VNENGNMEYFSSSISCGTMPYVRRLVVVVAQYGHVEMLQWLFIYEHGYEPDDLSLSLLVMLHPMIMLQSQETEQHRMGSSPICGNGCDERTFFGCCQVPCIGHQGSDFCIYILACSFWRPIEVSFAGIFEWLRQHEDVFWEDKERCNICLKVGLGLLNCSYDNRFEADTLCSPGR